MAAEKRAADELETAATGMLKMMTHSGSSPPAGIHSDAAAATDQHGHDQQQQQPVDSPGEGDNPLKRARLDRNADAALATPAAETTTAASATAAGAAPAQAAATGAHYSQPPPYYSQPALLQSHVVRPRRACCGLFFDVINKFSGVGDGCASGGGSGSGGSRRSTGDLALSAVHVGTWSASTRRPVLRVFAFRGSYTHALAKAPLGWMEVAVPTELERFPALTRVPFPRVVPVLEGECVGVYLHTADNWGVPFVLAPSAWDVGQHGAGAGAGTGSGSGGGGNGSGGSVASTTAAAGAPAVSAENCHLAIGLARGAMSHHPFANLHLTSSAQPCFFSGSLEYRVKAAGSAAAAEAVPAAAAPPVAGSAAAFAPAGSADETQVPSSLQQQQQQQQQQPAPLAGPMLADSVRSNVHSGDGSSLPAKRFPPDDIAREAKRR